MRRADIGRVLVVEDNDLNYELVQFILSSMGLIVLRANHGAQVLDVVTAEHPDLIYMDIQLPGVGGLELTRRLKADKATEHIPVIALTAFAMAGDEEKALAAGCDAITSQKTPIAANAQPRCPYQTLWPSPEVRVRPIDERDRQRRHQHECHTDHRSPDVWLEAQVLTHEDNSFRASS